MDVFSWTHTDMTGINPVYASHKLNVIPSTRPVTQCKTREISNFLKNGKMVILVKIQNFFRYRMTKQTFFVGIVSRNLATPSNFVEFRDNKNLHVFRGNERNAGHLAHFE